MMTSSVDHVIEGEVRIGGQEHFYLETNANLVTKILIVF
jgi:xanthine dehydrogenase molybdopterin-binding subunit B